MFDPRVWWHARQKPLPPSGVIEKLIVELDATEPPQAECASTLQQYALSQHSSRTEGIQQMAQANDFQVGGKHYSETDIQSWDAITAWGLGFLDGNVVKYMSRWRKKGGLQDLLKAQHYLSKVIEEVERTENHKRAAANLDPDAVAKKFAPVPPKARPPDVPPVTMKPLIKTPVIETPRVETPTDAVATYLENDK